MSSTIAWYLADDTVWRRAVVWVRVGQVSSVVGTTSKDILNVAVCSDTAQGSERRDGGEQKGEHLR